MFSGCFRSNRRSPADSIQDSLRDQSLDEDGQQVVGEYGRRAAFTSPSKYDKEEKKRQDARRYQKRKAKKDLASLVQELTPSLIHLLVGIPVDAYWDLLGSR